ncbi:MAG: hypothetical protein J2P48_24515, partial [Alphaproteobacteria bacterium]|nr:hypothetical protein [Alphaproteobacteria bacterium]
QNPARVLSRHELIEGSGARALTCKLALWTFTCSAYGGNFLTHDWPDIIHTVPLAGYLLERE